MAPIEDVRGWCFGFLTTRKVEKLKIYVSLQYLITKLKLYENRRFYEEIVTCAGISLPL